MLISNDLSCLYLSEGRKLKNTNNSLETYVYIEILDTYNMFILLKVRQIDEYFDSLIEK